MNLQEVKQEHISKVEDHENIYEIKMPVVNHEIVTVNAEVLNNDILAAQESVDRRKSELASAEEQLATLKSIKLKIAKVK